MTRSPSFAKPSSAEAMLLRRFSASGQAQALNQNSQRPRPALAPGDAQAVEIVEAAAVDPDHRHLAALEQAFQGQASDRRRLPIRRPAPAVAAEAKPDLDIEILGQHHLDILGLAVFLVRLAAICLADLAAG
jgi:hypothetical protein